MLEAEKICLSLNGKKILNNISCQFATGRITGLIGPNGAGKTSLLKMLAGLAVPDSGKVVLYGQNLSDYSPLQLAEKLAYLPQSREIHWNQPVRDIIALGRWPYHQPAGFNKKEEDGIIPQLLEQLHLRELADRQVLELSGGEQARVLLGRALAQTPEFLLADEPLGNMDPAFQLETLKLLRHYAKQGMSIIIILHDLTMAARYCDEIILLNKGSIYSAGDAKQVFTHDNLKHVFHLDARLETLEGKQHILF